MKFNKLTDATKMLLMAAAIIITCLIVYVGMSVARSAQDLGKNANKQISKLDKDISNSGIMAFDNEIVNGSEVANLIREQLSSYAVGERAPIYIEVHTDTLRKYTNKEHLANIRDFTHAYYIKPTARFKGEVIFNDNDVIIGVKFEQQ